jgi:glycosyltransferase involved in cell wall biosynthesis
MNIITLTNNWRYFIQHRVHVVECAKAAGCNTSVIGPEGEIPETLVATGLMMTTAPIVGRIAPWCDLRALRVIMAHLKDLSDPLVHAITLKPTLLALILVRLWRLTGRKDRLSVVVTFPGLGFIFARQSRRTAKGWVRYRLVALFLWLFLRGPRVWATFETQADLDFIRSVTTLDHDHMILISGTGVDLEVFSPARGRERTGFSVLFAGRLLRSKGIMEFAKVAERLGPQGIGFDVAGWEYDSPDGLQPDEVHALMNSRHIRFHGFIEDMPTLLRSVDAVVLPSSYPEGIPKIFLEAAACGLPIISTDFPGARRVIEDGVTGLIIKAPTVEHIEAAILAINNQPDRGKGMGDKALGLIKQGHFSERDIQKQFMDVFEKAQNKGG